MALHEHHLLGQPIDKGKIGRETRNNFREACPNITGHKQEQKTSHNSGPHVKKVTTKINKEFLSDASIPQFGADLFVLSFFVKQKSKAQNNATRTPKISPIGSVATL